MRKMLIAGLMMLCSTAYAYARQPDVYPTNWWTGMKHNKIQLLLKSEDSEFNKSKISVNYPGVTITDTHTFENGKYLAIDITISDAAMPGNVDFICLKNAKTTQISWPLKARKGTPGKDFAQGISQADMIYLLMPDRFSNGDPSNDKVPGLKDQSLNRADYYARHGGDFQGVINHLDYFKQLGITSIWMTPVMENDMPDRTEHGYAITNHYKIDPRYGGNAMYKKLSDTLHQSGMKLVQDAVYNHTGTYHMLVQDLPAKDWLNQWPVFTATNAREQTLFDPYASAIDRRRMTDGWFVKEMPDWNQKNPYVANFIIENAIWYVEEFGVDAIRVDTYTYNDAQFSNNCNQALMEEYPAISIFGEILVQNVPNQVYFVQNNINTPFKSNLEGVVDFQCLFNGIAPALTQEPDWNAGVAQLYNVLSYDYLYKDPTHNVLLLDNHDLDRFASRINGDVAKQKIAYTWLLTGRGIPQLYYGSEVLMKGEKKPDGLVRLDFPGGWANDQRNAFTGKGMNEDELAVQNLVKKLGTFRKTSSALTHGKLMQYAPENGLYIYFRYDDHQTIMCVMNTAKEARKIDVNYYNERTGGFSSARDVITDKAYKLDNSLEIPAMQEWVLELSK
ncbi:alpha-amylase family glycosyl hydrolase [Chitinophaga sp. Cy-1792]|uniref:alpha-amylase family glycosyl hydrolase n=1 Tax=Chitinophaga sp. Cy-1792 TaxID=2608339 RepID=UPI0014203561|nr:alpha-amylase family glycosyl hydrolase [Chitinophaga sp. Cy-1792]NIG55551.1 alpha-amylase [Chitinophaga sp. Cy-1792]